MRSCKNTEEETSLDSAQIPVPCGDPDILLWADHFVDESSIGEMVGGCDRERRPSVQYTRGQVFWKVEHAHSVGGEAVFNIPPSVALPRVSSLYFGAHGPHWSGVLTPGDLFRRKPLPNPRLLTRLFLPRDYTAPQKVDRASFSQFLFILATSPSGQEREKRIVFVWCSGQSIDGGRTDRQLPY